MTQLVAYVKTNAELLFWQALVVTELCLIAGVLATALTRMV